MSNNTIFVTGGAGFIGSHLCTLLVGKGENVICIDNLVTGNKDNIESLLNESNFTFINADIREKEWIQELKLEELHEIYDLASPASVTRITEHPIEAATVNAVGLLNLLDLAVKHKAKLLFASSSEAYGDPKEHPQKESYWGNVNPVGVRSGYDEGKRFGESLCMAYMREKGISVRIARIFNTYGPNSDPNDSRVIPSMVTRALRGLSIHVHGDGKQTRSFCYVSDLVNGLVKLMKSDESMPVNLGNPDEYSILKIAQLIKEATKSSSEIKFIERPEDDPSRRKPDIEKAKQLLGWEPTVSLRTGILKTIRYFTSKNGQ